MQIFGVHIITDGELRRQRAEAHSIERNSNNHLVEHLLFNAEAYRKYAQSQLRIPIALPDDSMPGINRRIGMRHLESVAEKIRQKNWFNLGF